MAHGIGAKIPTEDPALRPPSWRPAKDCPAHEGEGLAPPESAAQRMDRAAGVLSGSDCKWRIRSKPKRPANSDRVRDCQRRRSGIIHQVHQAAFSALAVSYHSWRDDAGAGEILGAKHLTSGGGYPKLRLCKANQRSSLY